MRIIKLVLTTLFIFISLNIPCAFSSQELCNTQPCIQSIKKDTEFINNKNTHEVIIQNRNNSNIASLRRNENNNANSNDATIFVSNFQIQKIIRYIKNQYYLSNNPELALLPLLHQIQPNAP